MNPLDMLLLVPSGWLHRRDVHAEEQPAADQRLCDVHRPWSPFDVRWRLPFGYHAGAPGQQFVTDAVWVRTRKFIITWVWMESACGWWCFPRF